MPTPPRDGFELSARTLVSPAGYALDVLGPEGSSMAADLGRPGADRPAGMYRAAELLVLGTGGDGKQVNFRLVWSRPAVGPAPAARGAGERELFGHVRRVVGAGTARLSAVSAAAQFLSTDGIDWAAAGGVRVADELSFTPSAYWSARCAALGGGEVPAAYQPAVGDTEPASLFIPDVYDGVLAVEWDLGSFGAGAMTGCVALIDWLR